MKANAAISGSEVVLVVVAIRLAAMVLVGLVLLALPPRPRDPQRACLSPMAPGQAAQGAPSIGRQRADDKVLRDMLLHD